MSSILKPFASFLVLSFIFFGCSSSEDEGSESPTSPSVTIPLDVYKKVYGTTSEITIQSGYVYILSLIHI